MRRIEARAAQGDSVMKRRTFFAVAGVGLLGVFEAVAQQTQRVWRIGYLSAGPAPADRSPPLALRQALRDLGYSEGHEVTYIGRWAEARMDRLPDLAAELIDLKVDLVVTLGGYPARVLSRATSTIPVIFVGAADPERVGLIGTLARPAGNVTGFADNASALSAKRLRILKEAVPTASRIAVLWNAKDSAMTLRYREIDHAAQALGVLIQPLGVEAPNDFEHAFEVMARDRPDALFMITDALTNLNRRLVLDFAESHRLPAMYEFASLVHEGGLMSYGASVDDMYVRAAGYIDDIFKGVKPGDLPVEQPTRYPLVVNLKSAKAVGLTIPQALLLRADEVIQ